MMTRTEIYRLFNNIYSCDYAELQHITPYLKECGHNHGYNGWNYTVYAFDFNTCLVTGYRTSSVASTHIPYEICKKYNNKMRAYEEKHRGVNYNFNKCRAYAQKLVARMLSELNNKEV